MPPAKAAKRQKLASKADKPKKAPQKRAPKQQQQQAEPAKEAATPAEAAPAKVTPGKRKSRTLPIRPARRGGHCVLLSHLPAGLREPQLRRFISQFGRVSRIRVPRAAGCSDRDSLAKGTKGVAFVEMADPAAAKVVADTLDNYLMFTRLIRCKVLQDPKRLTFARDGRRQTKAQQKAKVAKVSDSATAARNRSRRLSAKVKRLQQLDPQFEFAQQ